MAVRRLSVAFIDTHTRSQTHMRARAHSLTNTHVCTHSQTHTHTHMLLCRTSMKESAAPSPQASKQDVPAQPVSGCRQHHIGVTDLVGFAWDFASFSIKSVIYPQGQANQDGWSPYFLIKASGEHNRLAEPMPPSSKGTEPPHQQRDGRHVANDQNAERLLTGF